MKTVITAIFAIVLIFPVVTEAKPRCKTIEGITSCRMPKRKKCSIKRPCIPKGYYRKNPPKFIFMS